MLGIETYLKSRLNFEPEYGNLRWIASKKNAGIQEVLINPEKNERVQFYLIKQIALNTSGAGGTVDLIDNATNKVIFTFANKQAVFNIFIFYYINPTSKLHLKTTAGGAISFSIAFQTISSKTPNVI